jgi:hypothetical protein
MNLAMSSSWRVRLAGYGGVVLRQVKLVMASEWVGADPASAGVVGTWFGTGLPDLSSTERSTAMSCRIENNSIVLEVDERIVATARFSEHAAADGQSAWIVSDRPPEHRQVRVARRCDRLRCSGRCEGLSSSKIGRPLHLARPTTAIE